eukprot:scaffold57656_cov61-Attheya_sp.AAC.1
MVRLPSPRLRQDGTPQAIANRSTSNAIRKKTVSWFCVPFTKRCSFRNRGTMRFSTLSVIAAGVGAASAFSSAPTFRASHVGTELYERKPFITGNWKLNPGTKQEAEALASDVAAAVTADSPCDVAIFVPFPFIETANSAVDGKLLVGAQ